MSMYDEGEFIREEGWDMSWDNKQMGKAVGKTSFFEALKEKEECITRSHAVLDSYMGGVGEGLPLDQRLEVAMSRILDQIEQLHREFREGWNEHLPG
jgi:hypothetical protein